MIDEHKTATRLREYLARAGLGQREAGRLLDVPERQMRAYCAGEPVPRVVMLAAEHLAHCRMPEGARQSECPECGGTYGTHREGCAEQEVASKATTTTTCAGLGTLTGRPENSDPISSNELAGVSCTGYYFTVSGAATSTDTAIVQPAPHVVTVGFDAPNCTGNAYVIASFNGTSISAVALANGAVFTTGDATVATNYWMLPPNTAISSPNIMSVLNGTTCSSWSGSLSAYALKQNDQTVSGVPSAPITGPITIG